jgi:hypothetical protein
MFAWRFTVPPNPTTGQALTAPTAPTFPTAPTDRQAGSPDQELCRLTHESTWVKLRPGARDWLRRAAERFELTAATSRGRGYGEAVAELLGGGCFGGRILVAKEGDGGRVSIAIWGLGGFRGRGVRSAFKGETGSTLIHHTSRLQHILTHPPTHPRNHHTQAPVRQMTGHLEGKGAVTIILDDSSSFWPQGRWAAGSLVWTLLETRQLDVAAVA